VLLPPSTNPSYAGAPWAAHLLAVLGVLTILPGLIHVLLPDGGAGTIAGMDLGVCGPTVAALFAWAGATQLVFGIAMLVVAVRYRPLVPAMFVLALLERVLHALNGWVLKPGSGHHPPEHYAVLVMLPILALGLVGARREPP
jgi:hypothetical protein